MPLVCCKECVFASGDEGDFAGLTYECRRRSPGSATGMWPTLRSDQKGVNGCGEGELNQAIDKSATHNYQCSKCRKKVYLDDAIISTRVVEVAGEREVQKRFYCPECLPKREEK